MEYGLFPAKMLIFNRKRKNLKNVGGGGVGLGGIVVNFPGIYFPGNILFRLGNFWELIKFYKNTTTSSFFFIFYLVLSSNIENEEIKHNIMYSRIRRSNFQKFYLGCAFYFPFN